jgi:hypothetical protein
MLAVILVVLILMYQRLGPPKPPTPPEPKNAAELSITDADVGDSIVVHGAGDSFADLTFTVDRKDRYEANGESWFEVSGRYRGRRVFVEVANDDEIEVLVNLANERLTLSDLSLREEDLVRFDETHDRNAGFSFRNSQWHFDWSGEIGYFKDGDGAGEGYYNWDFAEQGGNRVISVEKWEGDPFEVILSRRVNSDDVQVFRSSTQGAFS